MHVNAKQAAKNVKMTCYPKPLTCTLIQKNRTDKKNSVTASPETLYKSSFTTTVGLLQLSKAACKRAQQLSTLLRQQCWELLANNVASVCTGLKPPQQQQQKPVKVSQT